MSTISAINKTIAVRQTELYDAYLESIKDQMEAHDAKVQELTTEYHNTIKPFNDDYQESINPEYLETAAIVNPAVEKLKAKLQKIKERATKQTNDEMQKFQAWQDKVMKDLEPRIADRMEVLKNNIKPYEDAFNAKVEKLQAEFEEITKPEYENYIKLAEEIESEFATNSATLAKDKNYGHTLGVN